MPNDIAFYETLKKIVACIDNGDRQVLNQFSLTVLRYYALKHIQENPGISLTNLSTLMLNDKSSTTRLIRSMQEEGLVQRYRSESDRRTYCLYLSELGKQLYQRASEAHNAYIQDRYSNLDVDIKALVSNLELLYTCWNEN